MTLPTDVASEHPADDPGSPQGADYHAGLHNDVNSTVNTLTERVIPDGLHTTVRGDVGGNVRLDGDRIRRRMPDPENPGQLITLGSLMAYGQVASSTDGQADIVSGSWERRSGFAGVPKNGAGGLLVHASGMVEIYLNNDGGADVTAAIRWRHSAGTWNVPTVGQERVMHRSLVGQTIRHTCRVALWFYVPISAPTYDVELVTSVGTVQGPQAGRQFIRSGIHVLELAE